MERTLLCFAANGGANPLRRWKSCSYYEELIKKGYIEEVPADILRRRFLLSDKGRAKIVEISRATDG